MINWNLLRTLSASFIILIVFCIVFKNAVKRRNNKITSKTISGTAIFLAMSIILYIVPIFNISLPIFPSFLKIHIDEIPVFISGFIFGPWSAIVILLLKTIVKLPLSSTMGVGELADFIYSLAFVLPATLIYKKRRNFKSALIGFSVSILIQLFVSTFLTTFVILKFYIYIMRWDEDMILSLCQQVNPQVKTLSWPFLFCIALPFNLLKDGVVIAITLLIYKKIHKLIEKMGRKKLDV